MVFGEPPSEELIRTAYAREAGDTAILYKGMSLADIAHVVALVESKIIPRQAGGELLWSLLEIHPSPPMDFAVDPARGDSYQNRESYLRMLSPAVGWLSTGRARRESTTTGYRIAVRERLLGLAGALSDCAEAALEQCDAHQATLFPDYTYLQPAQPTVFAHYLLTFVYPILRDLERLGSVFARTNVSPAGCGSVNGSRLPLDREAISGMLGFDRPIPHARDAMWQADGPIETAALITGALVNLDRLAEDLQIFSTSEFGLVELSDRHARASVIMPQKKNPYSLAYLRGLAGASIGTLAAMAAVAKTPSGQIDNRMFAYGDVPRALDHAADAARLMADVLRGMTVKTDVAARRASQDFLGATDLAEVIMIECEIDYKTAHRIVARSLREALDSGESALTVDRLEAIAQATIGKKLGLSKKKVRETLDPAGIVATRTGLGGAASESVTAMIMESQEEVKKFVAWRMETGRKLVEAETRLGMKATLLKIVPPDGHGPPRSSKGGEPDSWEKEFEDLPKMPPGRGRFQGE